MASCAPRDRVAPRSADENGLNPLTGATEPFLPHDRAKALRAWAAALVPLLDAIPASAAVLDKDGTVVAVNAAWSRSARAAVDSRVYCGLGGSYVDSFRAARELVLPLADEVADAVATLLGGRREPFVLEYPCQSSERTHWFRLVAARLDGTSSPGVVVMHFDITAEKQAEETGRAKSILVAQLSHELRTPLNAIVGYAEAMKDQVFGPLGNRRYRDGARHIHGSASHLLRLGNDMLNLAKAEAGKLTLCEEEVDVTRAMRDAAQMVRERAKASRVTLTVKAPRPSLSLRADIAMFEAILINLLSNAVKFTEPGGRVTLRCEAEADGGIALSVTDTGIGIAPADIPKATESYGRLDMTVGPQREGSGLGLPLTKSFVELHGGSLDICSEMGVGTTVTVRFPRERILP